MDVCMMTADGSHDDGPQCTRAAAFVLVGPMYAPSQWLLDQGIDPDAPVGNQGFVCETRCCAEHLNECRDWFFDPDVHTLSDAKRLEAAAGSLAKVYGCDVVKVRAVPAA